MSWRDSVQLWLFIPKYTLLQEGYRDSILSRSNIFRLNGHEVTNWNNDPIKSLEVLADRQQLEKSTGRQAKSVK